MGWKQNLAIGSIGALVGLIGGCALGRYSARPVDIDSTIGDRDGNGKDDYWVKPKIGKKEIYYRSLYGHELYTESQLKEAREEEFKNNLVR